MDISAKAIIAFIVGLLIIITICRFFKNPVKWMIKLGLNGILGGIMLYVINSVGSVIGFHIELNIINSLVAGVLGFPGVILLVLIKLI